MKLLPKWILTNSLPAFNDGESATAIEQTYKVYKAMNELIDDYNVFADSINNKITDFVKALEEEINTNGLSIDSINSELAIIKNTINSLDDDFNLELETIKSRVSNVESKVSELETNAENQNKIINGNDGKYTFDWEVGYINTDGTDFNGDTLRIRTKTGVYYNFDDKNLTITIPDGYDVYVYRYSDNKGTFHSSASYNSSVSPKIYPVTNGAYYRFMISKNGESANLEWSNNVNFVNSYEITGGLVGENRLKGKSIVVLGDSMAKGHTLAENKTWAYKLAKRNDMQLTNLAVNGAYITTGHANDDSSIVNQVKQIEGTPDIIIIFAGTNDRQNSVDLGTWTSSNTDTTNLNGALRVIFDYIMEHFTTSKILFITPYFYQENVDYIGTIEKACEWYGIHCKNNKQGGFCAWNSNVVSTYFLDSVHLNELGQEKASYEYEGALKYFI